MSVGLIPTGISPTLICNAVICPLRGQLPSVASGDGSS